MTALYTKDELDVDTVLRLLGTWEESWRRTSKTFRDAAESARREQPISNGHVCEQQRSHLYSTGRADGLAEASRRLRALLSEGGDQE